ncbi:MAG: GAF domain-containing protein, partial [Alphaproteobacteria bacterium]|nr:GAF domain-containing protein [Alphaproteobacteria bacterium]
LPTSSEFGKRLARGEITHIADLASVEGPSATVRSAVETLGSRAYLAVPLRKDGALLGYLSAHRQEVGPFSDKQIALLQNLAAQAVIAMENARLLGELRQRTDSIEEALEYQTATSDVLQVISRSTFELQPVLDAIVDTAARLCNAGGAGLAIRQGDVYRYVATYSLDPEWVAMLRAMSFKPDRGTVSGRALLERRVTHVVDLAADPEHVDPRIVTVGGIRTLLAVPLLREEDPIGVLTVGHQRVQPFTERQIELVRTFADQAVIAMENARLLTETREALEQQTAAAEVLQVINSSPGELVPVFEAMLERAMRLCGAAYGVFAMYEGEYYHIAAARSLPARLAEFVRQPVRVEAGSMPDRLRRGEDAIQIVDITSQGPELRTPGIAAMIEFGNVRTAVWVALRKDGVAQGFFGVYRQEVRPFTDKQIALLQNFAAQAVIAMENARLLTETREALERQTATADVLRVINSSPGDLVPVFKAILEKAHQLCGVAYGALVLREGEIFRAVATHSYSGSFANQLRQGYRGVDNPLTRALLDGERFVQIPDLAQIDHPVVRASVESAGVRTGLYLPLRKDGVLLGMISSCRRELRPFSEKEIALLENFAAQAVIAIENARLLTETREALERQTATAEVLQVINSSPGDLGPVFDAMLEKAVSLCGASFGLLMRYDGEALHTVAHFNSPPKFVAFLQTPVRPAPGMASYRILRGEDVVTFADVAADPSYAAESETAQALVQLSGARSHLTVALRKEGAFLGQIVLYRQEVLPFTEKQIALIQNFAAQAVIAMENARLLTETREALEQQTATAEVLQVINSSPGELVPVFEAMLDKATSLCEASLGALWTYDGEYMHALAVRGASPEQVEFLRARPHHPTNPDNPHRRLICGERLVHIHDVSAEEGFRTGDPMQRALIDLGRCRTLLLVPLLKDDAFIGDIIVYRQEIRPFSDKQIALLQNFAAQAVIAMENARLINETREALEQQTATAEVLQVINSSPGDVAPVFDAILEKALSLCEAAHGHLTVYQDGHFHCAAAHGDPRFVEWFRRRPPYGPGPGTTMEKIVQGASAVQVADVTDDEAYRLGDPVRRAAAEIGGSRTAVSVALRKENTLFGAVSVYRQEVRPFTDKQIALLQNFAAQAVIAMENARLLTETREALEQQTATAEVLQVINSSPGDLSPVFDSILEKAHALCGVAHGSLLVCDGDEFCVVAVRDDNRELAGDPQYLEVREEQNRFRPPEGTPLWRLLQGDQLTHLADARTDESYLHAPAYARIVDAGGIRTLLQIPLRKERELLGVITAFRREVRLFTDKEIALLQNFAAQAVVAMENARLLTETREALEQQTATAEVLQVINSSPGDLTPVFDAILEKAHKLCGASSGGLIEIEGDRHRAMAVHGTPEFAEYWLGLGWTGFVTDAAARLRQGEIVHIDDYASLRSERNRRLIELAGAGSLLLVPLLKDELLLGAITAFRTEVRPFSDKEVALLENFAAQ